MTELAARTLVGEVVRKNVRTARCSTPLADVERALRTWAKTSVPVVDDAGKLLGLVSLDSLLRYAREHTSHPSPFGPCEEVTLRAARGVVVPSPHRISEDTTLSIVLAIFASYDLDDIPVVQSDGTFVGIVSSTDLLRWLALRMGYAVPTPGTPDPGGSLSRPESPYSASRY